MISISPWEAPPYFWSTVFIKISIRLSVARIRKGENPRERIFFMTFKLYCPKVIFTVKNIGVRPHEIHIKKIKQNQKFYKRNIKYLVKAYHK